jgi:hypothetical protein
MDSCPAGTAILDGSFSRERLFVVRTIIIYNFAI